MVKALINIGGDVDIFDNMRYSPLIRAAINERLECCEILINANCDINLKDKWGNTAMALAMKNKHPGIVKLLKSTAHLGKHTGKELSDNAIRSENVTLALKMISEGIKDVDYKNEYGMTSISSASSRD